MKDDHYKHLFIVSIGKEKSVAALKEAIKQEKSNMFREIDASSLVVWNVSIPYDRNLAENVNNLNLVDDDMLSVAQPNNEQIESLSPVDRLSDIFSEPPVEGHVHIVVEPPRARSAPLEDDPDEMDIITAIKTSMSPPFVTI